MKVSVKGGGMYGCVIADVLQENGYKVTLYEAAPDILLGASNRNFRRLHRGFHYPKSVQTALESDMAHDKFVSRYENFTSPINTTYWIANESEVSPEEYLEFVRGIYGEKNGYEVLEPDSVENVALGVGVMETRYDVHGLRRFFKNILDVKFRRPPDDVFTIDCTYLQSPLSVKCEYKDAVILRIRTQLPNKAQTVLYGPFCGLIPAAEGDFLFYHATLTKPNEMLADGARFFPELYSAVVLDVIETTHVRPSNPADHRPYLIEQTDEKEICVLGGKIAQSVDCARKVLKRLEDIGIVPDEGKAEEREAVA